MTKKSLLSHLADCRKRLEEKGFNLWGSTAIEAFDAGECRSARLAELGRGSASAVVVGSGGRALWERLRLDGRVDRRPRRGRDPIDEYSREVLEAEIERFRGLGYEACAIFPFDSRPVNFVKLAEAAGIGVISPVVPFLLHPVYGPWVSLRGALLFNARIPAHRETADFAPCSGCDAPCVTACPVDVYPRHGPARLDRCAGHRHAGGCATGCDVRRACPVGAEHRYGPDEEAFRHGHSLPALRRWYGLGWWRFVPAALRRGP